MSTIKQSLFVILVLLCALVLAQFPEPSLMRLALWLQEPQSRC
jgi:hypothetical protein